MRHTWAPVPSLVLIGSAVAKDFDVASAADIRAAMKSAQAGDTSSIRPGEYDMGDALVTGNSGLDHCEWFHVPQTAIDIVGGDAWVIRGNYVHDYGKDGGSRILIYASSPLMSLVGAAVVQRVIEAVPSAIWSKVKQFAGVTKQEFDAYFAGATKAVAIFIQHVVPFALPVALATLRESSPSFRPPQSYRYLRRGDPATAHLDKWVGNAA